MPDRRRWACPNHVFSSVAKAVFESPESQMADTAGIQLTLSLAYAAYSLKEYKKMDLGEQWVPYVAMSWSWLSYSFCDPLKPPCL